MRNRRDDERGFRGMGEDEGRGYGGTEEQRRASGREREGGYGGYGGERDVSRQWGRDRDRYDRDFSGRDVERDEDYGRARNLGARDYETRHFGGGRGGFERGGGGGYGGSTSYGAYQGSYGMGGYGGRGGGMTGRGGGGGMMGGRGGGMRGEGWGREMGGTDLGFGYGEHEGYEQRGPHYGKGPKGYRRSDERIREDVCETIAQQGNIDASDVEVRVENKIVTLSGTVGARHEKRTLEQMIERVHGVDEVRNELRLRREERMQGETRAQTPGPMQTQQQQPSRSTGLSGQNGRAAR